MKPPLSKSDAQRALVLADILGVPFERLLPEGEDLPRDVQVLRDGLIALRSPVARIDCHDGGAPFRFLLTQAAVLPDRSVEFVGTPRLGERPHGPLIAALRAIPGVRIETASLSPKGGEGRGEGQLNHIGTLWPVKVTSSRIAAPVIFETTGSESSQFASSLLLGAARLAAAGVSAGVRVSGELTSEGYFALTRSWIERAGFQLRGDTILPLPAKRAEPPGATALGSEKGRGEGLLVPGDWSSLGYLLALSWVSGARVERIAYGTGHPDEAIATHLKTIGLTITDRVDGVPTRGFDADCEQCPDAIPTLAVIATKLPAPSLFRRVGILRHKESDRLAATMELLAAAGISSKLKGEDLTVDPGTAHDFRFDARDDHRLAMSAAVLARLHSVKLTLRGKDAVAKSFPNFWTEAAEAGVHVEAWQ